MKWALLIFIITTPLLTLGQTPDIFNVSDVVAGAQRTETRYFLASGQWSDDGTAAGAASVEVHCYQAFGFCEVAHAFLVGGQPSVALDTFDILRWDKQELIAIDSSPICLVNNLRADFTAKKVTLSSTSKGVKGDKICVALDADPNALKTAFLLGVNDELNRAAQLPQKKAKSTGKK